MKKGSQSPPPKPMPRPGDEALRGSAKLTREQQHALLVAQRARVHAAPLEGG